MSVRSLKKKTCLLYTSTKQVESAKNTMDSAALTLRQAQEELSRQQLLYAGGGLSDQQFSQYQNCLLYTSNKIIQHIFEKNGFKRCGKVIIFDGSERIAYQKIIE